ncbi:MAG: cytochrome c [Candidatus Acidiferrum sp.]
MKTRVPMFVLFFCAFLALAGAGVFAELQKGHYQPATLGQFPQAGAIESLPDSQYGGRSYPLYPPEMESGEGKAEVEAYCSMCHSTRYITMQPPLPSAAWEAEVTKMKKTFGATIPEEASSKIVSYLQTHYTPETRK